MDALLSTGGIPAAVEASYDIDNSLKLEQDNTEYLHKTPTSSGNRRTFTLSAWIKRTESRRNSGGGDYIFQAGDGDYNQSDRTLLKFNHDDTIYFGGGSAYLLKTNRVFRDASAWYHIALVVDTTLGSDADRLKLYVNGVKETDYNTQTAPSQNFQFAFMKDDKHVIGYNHTDASNPMSGYIAEVVWLDGTAADITSLGRFDDNGVWTTKDVSGLSVGTNGCYLDFKNSSNLGNDASGGTDFTLNNISASDQATDTPTNNFCTMNQNARTNGNIRTQEGGTYVTTDGGSGWCSMLGTMGMSAGKWYWEALVNDNGDALTVYVGIAPHNDPYVPHHQTGYYLGNVETAGSMGWYLSDGSNKNQNGSWGNPGRGDKIMFAYDADNYKMYYGINGTWGNSANPANGTGSVTAISTYWMSAIHNALDFVLPAVTVYQGKHMKGFNFGGYCAWTISSGNTDANGYGNFEYAPPSGFYALCSKNLAQYG